MLTLLKDLRRLRRAIALERPDRGRSLAVRHVDAGSCNGCEHELILVSSPYTDLQRFGIGIVASPARRPASRHRSSNYQDARAARCGLCRNAPAAARGCARRLRPRLQCARHGRRDRRPGRVPASGGCADPRLSAVARHDRGGASHAPRLPHDAPHRDRARRRSTSSSLQTRGGERRHGPRASRPEYHRCPEGVGVADVADAHRLRNPRATSSARSHHA